MFQCLQYWFMAHHKPINIFCHSWPQARCQIWLPQDNVEHLKSSNLLFFPDHMKACTDQVKGSNEKNLFLVTGRISPYKKISFHPHPNAKPDNDVLLTKFLGCLLSFFETFLNSFVLCIGVMNNWIITYINTPFWNIFPHLYLLFVSSPFWNIEIIFPQQDPKELSPFWCKEHII